MYSSEKLQGAAAELGIKKVNEIANDWSKFYVVDDIKEKDLGVQHYGEYNVLRIEKSLGFQMHRITHKIERIKESLKSTRTSREKFLKKQQIISLEKEIQILELESRYIEELENLRQKQEKELATMKDNFSAFAEKQLS